MFTKKELASIKAHNLDPQNIEEQIAYFKKGFPPLNIIAPATTKDGIKQLTNKRIFDNIRLYDRVSNKVKKVKFIPASGAATRMFKTLFEVMNSYNNTEDDYLKIMSDRGVNSLYYLLEHLQDFAFYDDLEKALARNNTSIAELSRKKDILTLLQWILTEQGMNYGNLPKGLLKFHRTDHGCITPFEEHLIEGAHYAVTGDKAYLHFTVSKDHQPLFEAYFKEIAPYYKKMYDLNFKVEYSIQKPETDTIAVNENNEPINDKNGGLVFRPGGHGALLTNLNQIKADIIFIKNIDNVTQERLKGDTYLYKKSLAGMLLFYQKMIHTYLKKLTKKAKPELIEEVETFLRKKLMIIPPDIFSQLSDIRKIEYLRNKLNRPIRICGMVQNEGEPGGGPFWVKSFDGTVQLQILESSQITEEKKHLMTRSTHFNPVDIVCSTIDYNGKKFDLHKFVDKQSGFISSKSVEGKEIKALELPGLWNGAMSDWITLFVEVPASTFSPVKTVNDLLRTEHMYELDLLAPKTMVHSMVI